MNTRFKKTLSLLPILAAFASSPGIAAGMADFVIQTGPNTGRRLIDVLDSYQYSGTSIPPRAIQDTLSFIDRNRNNSLTRMSMNNLRDGMPWYQVPETVPVIGNPRYAVIFDVDKSSSRPREHKIDLYTGQVQSTWAANGYASDCRGGGDCDFQTDNVANPNSTQTPLGFFSVGPAAPDLSARRPDAITLAGLEAPTPGGFAGNSNINTGTTGLAIHSADDYVHRGSAGHSDGCPAMTSADLRAWAPDIMGPSGQGGTLFYFYSSQLDSMRRDMNVANVVPSTAGARAR